MVSRRKRPTESPAPVAESWQRIESWLDEHLPAVKATLRPGISKRDLTKFEKAIGRPLPADVRESWMIHDGQGRIPDDLSDELEEIPESLGLLFGLDLNPLASKNCLSPQSALGVWKWWQKFIEGEADPNAWDDFDANCTSSPPGAIQCKYCHRGWIPLVTRVDSDYLGVDLDPGPAGVVGQVVNFGRNEDHKFVLANSWGAFLEDFADELDAGNFLIDLDEEYDEFRMREPLGRLCQHYRVWSEAKGANVRNDPNRA